VPEYNEGVLEDVAVPEKKNMVSEISLSRFTVVRSSETKLKKP
jgi:hypothetical protein